MTHIPCARLALLPHDGGASITITIATASTMFNKTIKRSSCKVPKSESFSLDPFSSFPSATLVSINHAFRSTTAAVTAPPLSLGSSSITIATAASSPLPPLPFPQPPPLPPPHKVNQVFEIEPLPPPRHAPFPVIVTIYNDLSRRNFFFIFLLFILFFFYSLYLFSLLRDGRVFVLTLMGGERLLGYDLIVSVCSALTHAYSEFSSSGTSVNTDTSEGEGEGGSEFFSYSANGGEGGGGGRVGGAALVIITKGREGGGGRSKRKKERTREKKLEKERSILVNFLKIQFGYVKFKIVAHFCKIAKLVNFLCKLAFLG